jgi:hypothetical protein
VQSVSDFVFRVIKGVNEEVNRTEPSNLVSLPWFNNKKIFLFVSRFRNDSSNASLYGRQ